MPYTIFLWFLYCHKNVGRIEINNFIENFIGLLPGRIWSGYAKEVSLVIYWNIYHLSWLHLSIEMFVRLTCRLKSSLEKSCFYFFCLFLMHRQGFVWNSVICFRDPLPDTYPVFSGDKSSDRPCCCDPCDSSVTPCFPQPGSELSLLHFLFLQGVGFPDIFPPEMQPENLSCSAVLSPGSPRQMADCVCLSLAISP